MERVQGRAAAGGDGQERETIPLQTGPGVSETFPLISRSFYMILVGSPWVASLSIPWYSFAYHVCFLLVFRV